MIYCERLLAIGGFEPWNAVTNAGFVLAAVWGYRAFHRAGLASRAVPRALVALALTIGGGSFAWHATGAPWAQWADVLPILVFVLTFLAATLRTLCGASTAAAVAACAALLGAAALLLGLFGDALNGSLAYLPVWGALAALAWILRRRGSAAWRPFAFAALLFALSLGLRTADLALCAATGQRGTHWLWHLANSALIAVLMAALARHAPTARRRAAADA